MRYIKPGKFHYIRLVFVLTLLLFVSDIWAADACGDLKPWNDYGPWDYTNLSHFKEKLPIVEVAHFTYDVETLQSGRTGELPGDINYVLMTFPNHHRALNSMMRWQLQHGGQKAGADWSIECYFQRALRLKPDDGVVYLIQGIYFQKTKDYPKAEESYQRALDLQPNSAEVHYNIGLLEIERKDFEKARAHANLAYSNGHPLPGLRNKLKRLGQWKDQ